MDPTWNLTGLLNVEDDPSWPQWAWSGVGVLPVVGLILYYLGPRLWSWWRAPTPAGPGPTPLFGSTTPDEGLSASSSPSSPPASPVSRTTTTTTLGGNGTGNLVVGSLSQSGSHLDTCYVLTPSSRNTRSLRPSLRSATSVGNLAR